MLPAPRTLATLHGERAGFREAGQWLAQHVDHDVPLVDPYAWANYYAGRVFQENEGSRTAAGATHFYVVVD